MRLTIIHFLNHWTKLSGSASHLDGGGSFVTHNGKCPSDQTVRFVFLKIVSKILGQIFGGPNNPWIWGSGNELEFVVENVFLLETFACG